jgi:hypothetical protein
MYDFTDSLLDKQRTVIATLVITFILIILCLSAPLINSYRSSISARIKYSYTSQQTSGNYNSANAITNSMMELENNTVNAAKVAQAKMLTGVMTTATNVTKTERASIRAPKEAIIFSLHSEETALVFTGKTIGSIAESSKHAEIIGALDTLHASGIVLTTTGHSIGKVAIFTSHGLGDVFGSTGHTLGIASINASHAVGDALGYTADSISSTFESFDRLDIAKTVIVPKDNIPVNLITKVFGFDIRFMSSAVGSVREIPSAESIIEPVVNVHTPTITQLRLQQSTLIQSNTQNVSVTPTTPLASGVGGACDAGDGNGGYPMSWCNAPMDTVATLPFNNDPINRECTSYAYWYFTVIEGHTDFRAYGNAKYWASSSNFPTESSPTVGSIAVETAGAYGHVAIVRALPGEEYAGQIVPSGYVLVSEMNYDWNGHFRYSYSPLNKFSSYIY